VRGHEVAVDIGRGDGTGPGLVGGAAQHVSGADADGDGVRRAVTGAVTRADAVISLLGPGTDKRSIPALVPGMRTIVDAMTDAGVRRLIATSTPSAADPTDGRDLRIAVMVRATTGQTSRRRAALR
jgi:nucleoside-diphosphate-sugar epimerase